ncbi:MAG: coenzyme F420-0:L-glutamate ligase [Pseudomonadota bacterium]|nr:coenzyme F420-0:L-glutamate ligase [Pseudomonadota bacterium]
MRNLHLELFAVPEIPKIYPGDDLVSLIASAMDRSNLKLFDGDVLIIAQKIVSKAEGRSVCLNDVKPSSEARKLAKLTDKNPSIVELIIRESEEIIRHRPGIIIAKHKSGWILANAGIDQSNVTDNPNDVLLLPKNPNQSAANLRSCFLERFKVKTGVIIADSVGRPWRVGTTGIALGSAGVDALVNLRGRSDLFGRILEVSEHGVADSIASAAELLLGEADEAIPVVILRGMNEGKSKQDARVLLRPDKENMFR